MLGIADRHERRRKAEPGTDSGVSGRQRGDPLPRPKPDVAGAGVRDVAGMRIALTRDP